MRSTGPILTIGAVTMFNQSIVHNEALNWRVAIATGFAAGAFALIEQGMPDVAPALAWVALVTVLLVRTNPRVPSPIESFFQWWEGK
jgi:hypothetical protein